MLAACRLATQADTVWDPCCREDVVTECSGICEMPLGVCVEARKCQHRTQSERFLG